MTDLSRRLFLSFAPLIVAAPAIVRASSLMPVKVVDAPAVMATGWNEAGSLFVYNGSVWKELLRPGIRDIIRRYDTLPVVWPLQFRATA